MNHNHALHDFMVQVTNEIASEYKRISSRATEDPGTAGDEGEANWAALFKSWLPAHFHVETKGRIMGLTGALSPQIDVLVLKPSYPQKLREKKIWLADGVAAAFECKNTLKTNHIAEAVQTAQVIKQLTSRKTGDLVKELRSGIIYGLLAHSHSWKSPKSKPLEIVENAHNEASARVSHPSHLLDVICVADLGCWMNEVHVLPNQYKEFLRLKPQQGATSDDWVIMTCLMLSSFDDNSLDGGFTPIGRLIGHLTKLLALTDEQSRALAAYFGAVLLRGQAGGTTRTWSEDRLSKPVREKILERSHNDRDSWDGWQRYF